MSVQASWSSLRAEFAALNPAQLHHMLREYSSGKACPTGWTPSPDDAEDAVRTGESQTETVLSNINRSVHRELNLISSVFRLFLKPSP